eukprot:360719-Chlamydomonas_euryale.AAC.11
MTLLCPLFIQPPLITCAGFEVEQDDMNEVDMVSGPFSALGVGDSIDTRTVHRRRRRLFFILCINAGTSASHQFGPTDCRGIDVACAMLSIPGCATIFCACGMYWRGISKAVFAVQYIGPEICMGWVARVVRGLLELGLKLVLKDATMPLSTCDEQDPGSRASTHDAADAS